MTALEHVRRADDNVFRALQTCFPADGRQRFVQDGDRIVTYGDIGPATARLANLLRESGVAKGDIVAGVLDKSPEAILLYLAVSRLGGVYLPVHIGLTPAEIDYVLTDAGPRITVCDPQHGAAMALAGRRFFTLDRQGAGSLMEDSRSLPATFDTASGRGEEPNALVYTSGTTGRPKGAIIPNGLVVWNALALADCWQITPADTILHANPMAYGLFGTTTPMIAGGGAIVLLPKFDAESVIAQLPSATIFAGVPTYYSRLLAHPGFDAASFGKIRLFITGSAPMRPDLFRDFERVTGHQLLDRYGSTEALIVSSNAADENREPNSSGRALPGSSIRIVDDAGKPVEQGTVGSIQIQQPFPFRGYLHAPEKTREAFTADGWFVSGDFGSVDGRGHMTVLGRGADLIITGGLNVYPKEVELAINRLENVGESAVIGVPHPDFGEAVVGVVQLTDPSAAFDTPGMLKDLKAEMAGYKVPKAITIVDQLPRNVLGKIMRTTLKEQFAGLFAPPGPSNGQT